MDHREWLDDIIGADSYRAAASKVGVDQSTLSRQLTRKGELSAENVIAIARAYGRRAGDELVSTGYLVPGDIEGVGVEGALQRATNKQLLEEIDRRMTAGFGDVFHEPIGSVDPSRPDLHLRSVPSEDDPDAYLDDLEGVAHDPEDDPADPDDSDDHGWIP
ncbi:helix-turn-helix domain-containing protein [Rhodococcus rhodnii]|uniref:helix-turn-helix domain-containing protein n=1 Tax=Rhodococcus rhodnii TaxID=38312 RepID=UPI0011606484|nr:helix-turn-helix transcriptional regulator [Rhodococcus rhodnii]